MKNNTKWIWFLICVCCCTARVAMGQAFSGAVSWKEPNAALFKMDDASELLAETGFPQEMDLNKPFIFQYAYRSETGEVFVNETLRGACIANGRLTGVIVMGAKLGFRYATKVIDKNLSRDSVRRYALEDTSGVTSPQSAPADVVIDLERLFGSGVLCERLSPNPVCVATIQSITTTPEGLSFEFSGGNGANGRVIFDNHMLPSQVYVEGTKHISWDQGVILSPMQSPLAKTVNWLAPAPVSIQTPDGERSGIRRVGGFIRHSPPDDARPPQSLCLVVDPSNGLVLPSWNGRRLSETGRFIEINDVMYTVGFDWVSQNIWIYSSRRKLVNVSEAGRELDGIAEELAASARDGKNASGYCLSLAPLLQDGSSEATQTKFDVRSFCLGMNKSLIIEVNVTLPQALPYIATIEVSDQMKIKSVSAKGKSNPGLADAIVFVP